MFVFCFILVNYIKPPFFGIFIRILHYINAVFNVVLINAVFFRSEGLFILN